MKTHAELKYLTPSGWPAHGLPANLRLVLRSVDVNWYQVAVVAIATFAIAMDLMFPPVRVAIGNGLDVYAGHSFSPLSTPGAVTVDFALLALELLLIVAAAVVGWRFGTPTGEPRESARSVA